MIPSRFYCILLSLYLTCCIAADQETKPGSHVRMPVLAGSWYPSNPASLRLAVEKFLEDAVTTDVPNPIALVAPHAGYAYSGQICADAYRQAKEHDYELVIILGTNHTDGSFRGISVYPNGSFRTPLGDTKIDEQVASALLAQDKNCTPNLEIHQKEHSIEIQLPFVQVLFPQAKIVPIIVGTPDLEICSSFGRVLAKILENRRALIVASSDLSHYPAYKDAYEVDRKTIDAITKLNPEELRWSVQTSMTRNIPNLHTCACGEAPIITAMAAAKSLGATRGVSVSYANSGDILIGNRAQVVGYGAIVFTRGKEDGRSVNQPASPSPPPEGPLALSEKKSLLEFARYSIQRYLETGTARLARGLEPRLERPRGAFVTLKKNGQLRGCFGHMLEDCALGQTVGAMAIQAAANDPRFPPVKLDELKELEIEISALTPLKPISGADEIVVGRDGVFILKDGKSAVFLPQVATENNWDYPEMLDYLCLKAGLPVGSWKEGAELYVFQAEVFSETELK